ncbi:MAG TPA: hypothetical protein VI168_06040 [Croceibacterium sp.]
MSDALRYRIIDEPRPSPLQRFALPPLLVFLAANFFLPWGWLLIAANAVMLNGPRRNREIGFTAIAIGIYFAAIAVLDRLLLAGVLAGNHASYLFIVAVGAGLVLVATAYVTQDETAQLRRYLNGQD